MFKLRLKDLREAKGVSQKQLANFLCVSQGSVGNWESGIREPNFETIKRIADYFNVSVDYLLCQTDSIEKEKRTETDAPKDNTIVYRKDGQTTEVELSKDKLNIVLKMIDALKAEDVDL